MKLLLTSTGLRHETLGALRELLGSRSESANIVYAPTAAFVEPGDHGCLIADVSRLHDVGRREFGRPA